MLINCFNDTLTDTIHTHKQKTQPTSSFNSDQENFSANVAKDASLNENVILPTLVAEGLNGDQEIMVRVLLDTGSTANFIKVGTSQRLEHSVIKNSVTLSVKTLHGQQTKICRKIKFVLQTRGGENLEFEAYEVDDIMTVPATDLKDQGLANSLNKRNLNEAFPRPSFSVDILIGGGDLWNIIEGIHERINSEFVIVKTKFGLLPSGKLTNCVTSLSAGVELLNKNIEKMFAYEEMPHDNLASSLTRDEIQAVELMEKNMRYDQKEGRFVTKLLWRGKPNLKNNFESAKQRLNSLLRKLKKDPVQKELYKNAFHEFITDKILEEVTEDLSWARDLTREDLYYLPHRAVFDLARKSTKLRVVFDASAKTGSGKSLNDCLLPGPPLQQKVASIELRFRTKKYALIGDCKKMFLQILIENEDRDFLRVLWQDPDDPKATLKIYRFTRLIFGATDSPFQAITGLQRLVRDKLADPKLTPLEEKVCNTIKQDTYVDDITTGGDSVREVIEVYEGLKELLAPAQFSIHKWATNSPEVLRQIPKEQRAEFSEESGISTATKTLGVKWDPERDLLLFDTYAELHEQNEDTKRSVASLLASLYDPGGIISPFVLRARQVLKAACVAKLNWTGKLSGSTLDDWHAWVNEIAELGQLSFPRYIKVTKDTQIHIFGDASGRTGYGFAIYARNYNPKKKRFDSHLLMARSKINPIKEQTIPRLELMAALLCVEAAEMVRQEISVPKENIICWSDSEIVLWWLKKDPSLLIPFVANRVEKIQKHAYQFSYINTKSNPADLCSRGCRVKDLKSSLWKHGPPFLTKPELEWPKEMASYQEINPLEGVRKQHIYSLASLTRHVENLPHAVPLHLSYHDHDKLLLKTAAVMHVFKHWQAIAKQKHRDTYNGNHTRSFLPQARLYWIKQAQEEAFPEELKAIRNEEPIKTSSKLRNLNPHLDERGILRVGGRLGAAPLPNNAKFPIILPKEHGFTTSLLRKVHLDNEHAGIDWCHFHARQQYWILSSRQVIRKIIYNCFLCQKANAVRGAQQMAPLPRERIAIEEPFTNVGVDYTGELKIKMSQKSTKIIPSYLAIFTCMTTRAIHIEVVLSNTTEDFIMAFKRMVSTRGNPRKVFSDNALYFKRANQEILETVLKNNKDIEKLEDQYKFKWYFSVEYHSAGSGVWERMVRSVKEPLRKILGDALVTYTELITITKEIEAHINDRPLVQHSTSSFEVITPSMLCLGRKIRPLVDYYDETSLPQEIDIRERHKYRKTLFQNFFNSWVKQYVLSLQQRNRWQSEQANIKEGDLVLVEVNKLKKHKWPLARVKEVIIGRDGLIRSVHVVPQGQENFITRSVRDVFPLENYTARKANENLELDKNNPGKQPEVEV